MRLAAADCLPDQIGQQDAAPAANSRPVSAGWRHARRLLCIRLDYMGDVLMCTPAIRALKQSIVGSHLTLLSSASGAAVAALVPEIDASITYAAPWMKSSQTHAAAIDLAMIEQLRAGRFDAAVIFTTYSQSALPAAMLCTLADIPLRLAWCRENPYGLLSDWLPDPEPAQLLRHEVQRQLDLVAAIHCMTSDQSLSLTLPQMAIDTVALRLAQLGLYRRPLNDAHQHAALAPAPEPSARPWLLLHPGASAASRRYPPALWSAVASRLMSDLGYVVVFCGAAQDRELIGRIRAEICAPATDESGPRHLSLAGELSLAQLGALIAAAPLLLANNSGPAHIAAALGTPVVQLYALTNPQHTPWQVRRRVLFHDVPCRNCYKSICPEGHHHCLSLVEPERVIAAVRELMMTLSDTSDTSDTSARTTRSTNSTNRDAGSCPA